MLTNLKPSCRFTFKRVTRANSFHVFILKQPLGNISKKDHDMQRKKRKKKDVILFRVFFSFTFNGKKEEERNIVQWIEKRQFCLHPTFSIILFNRFFLNRRCFILLFFFITFLKILLFQHFFPFQSQKLRPDRIYFTWTYWHIFSLFLSQRELLVFCFFSYFFYLFFPSPFFLHKHHISQWEPHFHVFFLFSFFRFSVDRSF